MYLTYLRKEVPHYDVDSTDNSSDSLSMVWHEPAYEKRLDLSYCYVHENINSVQNTAACAFVLFNCCFYKILGCDNNIFLSKFPFFQVTAHRNYCNWAPSLLMEC